MFYAKNGCLKHEKPVIEAFLVWLKFAATVNYALNRRDLMMTYLEDGRCSLSNNLSEQKMKSFVTGRKGWLFCDTLEGAEASAIAYSFAEMASAHHLNVYKYIKYLPDQRPNDQMEDAQLEAMSHRMKT